MKRAKITKPCRVFRNATVETRDDRGRVTTRAKFLAGQDYNLPEWWYTPLREQGALTPPGGEQPPAWQGPAIADPPPSLNAHSPEED